MVPISLRMKTIADMVEPADTVADIGCDHGFVSIYLVQTGRVKQAVAMDINEGPLRRAGEHIRKYGFEDRIDTRLSDGADKLENGEAQSAVIAGMGGRLTVKIIEADRDKFKAMKSIVLSPHSELDYVRKYLSDTGYVICDEDMVYDEGKYYTIIRCAYSKDALGGGALYDKTDLKYGPVLIKKKHPVLIEYLKGKRIKLESIEKKIQSSAGLGERGTIGRLKEVREEKNRIECLIGQMQN